MQIRESTSGDIAALVAMYPAAFPDEDLVPLVEDLLADTSIRLSLVATFGERIAGNVIFTDCSVDGSDARVALLAPLAVAPDYQRQGIGSALVRDGLRRLKKAGFGLVCVLGDPAYYGRFGFVAEQQIEAPYALPPAWAEAWQSQRLREETSCSGQLRVPPQWQNPELWTDPDAA